MSEFGFHNYPGRKAPEGGLVNPRIVARALRFLRKPDHSLHPQAISFLENLPDEVTQMALYLRSKSSQRTAGSSRFHTGFKEA